MLWFLFYMMTIRKNMWLGIKSSLALFTIMSTASGPNFVLILYLKAIKSYDIWNQYSFFVKSPKTSPLKNLRTTFMCKHDNKN